MYQLQEPLSVNYILHNFDQEQLMEYYLGVPLQLEGAFCSPFRKDNNPSCSLFYTKNGTLYFKDFTGIFSGDVFSLVKYLYSCSFHECLNIIAKDFNLLQTQVNKTRAKIIEKKIYPTPTKTKCNIQVKRRKWSYGDKKYWEPYGITSELLEKFDVKALSNVWVNGTCIYSHKEKDPGYVYKFGKDHFKIYFPTRTTNRFLSNTSRIQGLNYLPKKGNVLVITKSYKDVILLNSYGIPAIAPQSESSYPSKDIISDLKERFYKVFTLYDFDYAGVKTASKARKLYGIQPLFITNGRFNTYNRKAKDITDYYKVHGRENTRLLIEMAKSKYIRKPNK